jgi:glyoxylase-like metal-dependent hydrolase (beta-lactamase superfamily II)
MHYQIFERGWLSSNNILFFDDDGASLVDTGYCTHVAQTLALVDHTLKSEQVKRGPAYTLKRIINTHLHSDHCGGNAAMIAAYPGVEVLIPEGEAEAVAAWDEAKLSYQATGQECPRFMHTGTLNAGDTLKLGGTQWQLHAAPGHDPQSLILFEPQSRMLISADALWENGCGVIFPELRGEPGFRPALATLELIAELAPITVIPGHGAPFTDVSAALKRAKDRLLYLQAEPTRNAAHGLRVLLKFKLMQSGQISEAEALAWLQSLAYFQTIRCLHFNSMASDELAANTVTKLLIAGAAKRLDKNLVNA